jgi:hypothetical protein
MFRLPWRYKQSHHACFDLFHANVGQDSLQRSESEFGAQNRPRPEPHHASFLDLKGTTRLW